MDRHVIAQPLTSPIVKYRCSGKNAYVLVVCSNIEGDGKSLLRLDASQGCVEGQLAHRDTHPVNALKGEEKMNIVSTLFYNNLRRYKSVYV